MFKKIILSVFIVVTIALAYSIGSFAINEVEANVSAKAPSHFLIGVWAQPIFNDEHPENFAFWKSIGVNTIVGHDSGPQKKVTEKEWDTEAREHGLKVIRMPSKDAAYDTAARRNGTLIALMIPDENDRIAPNTTGYGDMKTLDKAVLNITKSIRAKDPDMPVFANYLGANISGNVNKSWYTRAILEGTDFYSYDFYPINNNYSIEQNLVGRFNNAVAWSGRAPLMYIEISDQHLNSFPSQNNPAWAAHNRGKRGPLPYEIRGEIAISVAEGAPGYIFFAHTFYPFKYDGSSTEAKQVLKTENALWSNLTADGGLPLSGLPTGLVGSRRLYNGAYKNIIANYTYNTIKVGNYTFGPLDYKILNDGEVPSGVVTTTPNPQPTPSPTSTRTPTSVSKTLTVSCKANKSEAKTKSYVYWTANVSGGKRAYTYTWNGTNTVSHTVSRMYKQFNTSGTKEMSLTVTSKDGQTKTVPCDMVNVIDPVLVARCTSYVSKLSGSRYRVQWMLKKSGGIGSYTKEWTATDNVTGTSNTLTHIYKTGGTKIARVHVTSGSQSVSATCETTLPEIVGTH
jgi:hypothetical protein